MKSDTGQRTKAERAVDEAAAELKRRQAEQPPRPALILAARERLDKAWRAVNQVRGQL